MGGSEEERKQLRMLRDRRTDLRRELTRLSQQSSMPTRDVAKNPGPYDEKDFRKARRR